MGFFSDLKEDLAQAVNELTEDTAEKQLLEEEELLKKELESMEDEMQFSGVDEPVDSLEEYAHYIAEEAVYEVSAEENEYAQAEEQEAGDEEISSVEEGCVNEDVMAALSAGYADATSGMEDAEVTETVTDAEEVEEIEEIEEVMDMAQFGDITVNEEIVEVNADASSEEVGLIPAGMMISGDITMGGALDLKGTVFGNIEIGGKLNVSGSIQGNATATEVFAQSAKITGDVNSLSSVKIGHSSVVIGNIIAKSAVIAGAVKGDIDVQGPVILDSSAIVMGNIKSKSVQINNGAVIEGMCSQCYAEVNPSSFFEGIKE